MSQQQQQQQQHTASMSASVDHHDQEDREDGSGSGEEDQHDADVAADSSMFAADDDDDSNHIASSSKVSPVPAISNARTLGSSRLKPGEELLDEATQAKILQRRQRDAARKRREKELKRGGADGAASEIKSMEKESSDRRPPEKRAVEKKVPEKRALSEKKPPEKKAHIIVTPAHRESEDEEEEENIEEAEEAKAYCICKGAVDDTVMIACDRCDDWYHATCLKMKEQDIELIDVFICPRCEQDTPERTTWKPQCSRQGCITAARPPLSRYCSDRCGMLVASGKLNKTKYIKDPERLLSRPDVKSATKKEGQVIWSEGDNMHAWFKALALDDEGFQDHARDIWVAEQEEIRPLQSELKEVIARKEAASVSLDLFMARVKLLQLAEDRATVLPQLEVIEETSTAKKSKAKAKAGGSADASGPASGPAIKTQPRCGYDERLSWDDERFGSWAHSPLGASMLKEETDLDGLLLGDVVLPPPEANEEGLSPTQMQSQPQPQPLPGFTAGPSICGVSKRKCRRHADWSTIRGTDFEAEREAQTQLLTMLSSRTGALQSLIAELKVALHEKMVKEDEKVAMRLAMEDGGGSRMRGVGMVGAAGR